MKTTYRPVQVTRLGEMVFRGGRLYVSNWGFDLGGRPPRLDWEQAYARECAQAVIVFLARRIEADLGEQPLDLSGSIDAERIAGELLRRVAWKPSASAPAPAS